MFSVTLKKVTLLFECILLGPLKSLEAFVLADFVTGRPLNCLVIGRNDQICPLCTPLSLPSLSISLMLFPFCKPHVSHYIRATSCLVTIISSLTILAHMQLHALKVSSCLNHKIEHFITVAKFITINFLTMLLWMIF